MVRGTFLILLCSVMLMAVAPVGHADGGAPSNTPSASKDNTAQPGGNTTAGSSGQAVSNPSLFLDVPSGHWALEDLRFLVEYGVITGLPSGYFKGEDPMTRYSASAMMARALRLMMNNPDWVSKEDLKALQDLLFTLSESVEKNSGEIQAMQGATPGDPTGGVDPTAKVRLDQTVERVNQAEATLLAVQQELTQLKRDAANAPSGDNVQLNKLKQQANANFIIAIASLFVGIIGIALATMT